MVPFRFPFVWGTPGPIVTPPVVVPPPWTRAYGDATNWVVQGSQLVPRFQHVYTLPDATVWIKETA